MRIAEKLPFLRPRDACERAPVIAAPFKPGQSNHTEMCLAASGFVRHVNAYQSNLSTDEKVPSPHRALCEFRWGAEMGTNLLGLPRVLRFLRGSPEGPEDQSARRRGAHLE